MGHVFKCVIDRGTNNYIGISLAGHRDRNKMACFVAGVNPKSLAATSQIVVGDEIVEVNGIVLHGRCHLNASVIIKEMAGSSLHFILLRFVYYFFNCLIYLIKIIFNFFCVSRHQTTEELVAVKPLKHFPLNTYEVS